jgi:phage baseplate assembly protein W
VNIDFPFAVDGRGATALVDDDGHVRDMIEQVLFTAPGERVNRPEFGSGLIQLLFAPNSPELATAVQFTIQAALQRWLGDLIELRDVEVVAVESVIQITVGYTVRATGVRREATFSRAV